MSKKNKVHNIYKDNQKTNKLPIIIALSVLALLIVGTVVVVVISRFSSKGNKNDIGYNDVLGFDATIITSFPVSEYDGAVTPSEAKDSLDKLGFENYQVIANYSMDGKYLGEDSAKIVESEEHPTYDIQYVTESGDLWIIYIYGGQIMANPVSYNLQSSRDVLVLISEKETITSYSSKENCFYEIIPADTELLVFTVDKINAETLESLTMEALDEL